VNIRFRFSLWPPLAALLLVVATGTCQYVEDSVDVGGAWVGSLCYNSRAGVVYGASEDGVCFAISCDSDKVISLVPAPGALSVCYDSLDNKAYCVTQGGSNSDTVIVIDGATHTRIGAIPVWWAVQAVWNPDNDRVYVSTDEYNKVVVIDCRGDSVLCEIAVGQSPIGLTLNRRHQKLYVQNTNDASVSVVDLNTNQVLRTIQVYNVPVSGWFSEPADKYYCGRYGGVVIIDGAGDSVVQAIFFPASPEAVAGSDVHGRVFAGLSTGTSDSVAALDMQGDTVVAMLRVGREPTSLAWSARSDLVYCASGVSDNLSVIAGDGSRILKTVTVSSFPAVLLSVPEFKRVYVGHSNTRLVYVVRDTSEGIAETPKAEVRTTSIWPTIVRGVLYLPCGSDFPVAMNRGLEAFPTLLDAMGRNVLDLRPGANDVSRLSPGVYFVREQSVVSSQHSGSSPVTKVVKLR